MRKTMKADEMAYRAVARWTDAASGDLLREVIVGPYKRPEIAKGSLSQEIWSYYGLAKKYDNDVQAGRVLFDRWVEQADTTWKRL